MCLFLLAQEGDQYSGSYCRTDHTRDVGSHAIVEHMVLRIVFGGNFVAHTAGHRHSAQTGGTDQRIDFLLAEQVEYLHHHDTRGDREGKGQESAYDDTDGLHVQEGIISHRGTYTQSQEDGSGVHDGVGGRVKQTAGIRADFLQQVSEHQHTDERYGGGHEERYNRGHGYREDDLQRAHVLDFIFRRVQLLLFLHIDHQFLLAAGQFYHQWDDYRHQRHVRIGGDGNRTEQMRGQLDGGKDGGRTVGTTDNTQ